MILGIQSLYEQVHYIYNAVHHSVKDIDSNGLKAVYVEYHTCAR